MQADWQEPAWRAVATRMLFSIVIWPHRAPPCDTANSIRAIRRRLLAALVDLN